MVILLIHFLFWKKYSVNYFIFILKLYQVPNLFIQYSSTFNLILYLNVQRDCFCHLKFFIVIILNFKYYYKYFIIKIIKFRIFIFQPCLYSLSDSIWLFYSGLLWLLSNISKGSSGSWKLKLSYSPSSILNYFNSQIWYDWLQ